MRILICNAGSTSLKFKLYTMPEGRVSATGKVERVGSDGDAVFRYEQPADGRVILRDKQDVPNYETGIRMFLDCLTDGEGVIDNLDDIAGVGFKTVLSKGHYGVHELDEAAVRGMRDWLVVAPAHNAAYLAAVEEMATALPNARRVGVFETDFHKTIPPERRIYSVPYDWYAEHGVQRMGYHGASHGYVASVINHEKGAGRKIISCHLGGSCSLCAIDGDKSVDNSFGFSLQAGVMHNNRVGDMDAFIIPYMMHEGLTFEEVIAQLSKASGLYGISGVSPDLRYIEEAAAQGNSRARLALDMFANDIIRYIGAYYAELGGLTDLVFTAGIGENNARLRADVCAKVAHFGIRLDPAKNNADSRAIRIISEDDSPVTVWVIPADEEIVVATKTYQFLTGEINGEQTDA